MASAVVVATLFCMLGVSACSHVNPLGFDISRFDSTEALTLCFDLSSEKPNAGVVLRPASNSSVQSHSLFLPFVTSKVEENKDFYVTWGTFEGGTLINYILSPARTAPGGFALLPKFDEGVESDFQRSELTSPLCLLGSGLKRRFFFSLVSPSVSPSGGTLAKLSVDPLDAVCVRLPERAEIFEKKRGVAHIRERQDGNYLVRTFPSRPPTGDAASAIDISYQTQPTSSQKAIFEYGLKLFGVLLIPLLGIAFLGSKNVKERQSLRKVLLWTGAGLELVILVGLVMWALKTSSVSGPAPFLDIGVAIVGALATAALALVKGQD